ncbi:MAG TPA: polysaccharide pyruvyl transferase family protein [Acidobacteriota bacterium]|jgi:polysaccharide pyruvyl transferase WcaK-like protein
MRSEDNRQHLKVCLLGASFTTGNMGVSALTAATIKCILTQFPTAVICLLDYGLVGATYTITVDGRAIPIRLVNMRFSKRFFLTNNIAFLTLLAWLLRFLPFQQIRNKLISANPCLNLLNEADIVGSLAGGDSFSDIYGHGRFFYVALPQVLALLLGKQLVLLPQTFGPFRSRIVRVLARYILKRSSVVYSRDFMGATEITKLLRDHSDKLRFCYDLGFVLDPVRPALLELQDVGRAVDRRLHIIGLNVSGLLFNSGQTGDNIFGLRTDYSDLVHDLIASLLLAKNVAVILIPHVFSPPAGPESDSVVCATIFESLKHRYPGRLFLPRGSYDQSEIKYVIGLCDFFIGSRMHACIGALSQNIPAVAIAYSGKFLGVMQTIEMESLVADPRRMGKAEILNMVAEAYQNRDLLRRRLEQRIPEVKDAVLNLFNDIGDSAACATAGARTEMHALA